MCQPVIAAGRDGARREARGGARRVGKGHVWLQSSRRSGAGGGGRRRAARAPLHVERRCM